MERKPVNCTKASRIIQQKSVPGGQLSIADNRTNPAKGLMADGKVAQRVIQRAGAADGKFVYVPDISVTKDRIPFDYGFIKFAPYDEGRQRVILSAGFSGCFMMAFRFTALAPPIFYGGHIPPGLATGQLYVAHVSNDIRAAVLDAKERNLITIEAMFRPYRNGVEEANLETIPTNVIRVDHRLSDGTAGILNFTAGMRNVGPQEWVGACYTQEKIPLGPVFANQAYTGDYEWINHKIIRTYDERQMQFETLASEAYICASVIADSRSDSDLKGRADTRLRAISSSSQNAIIFARDHLTKPQDRGIIQCLDNYVDDGLTGQ